MAKKPTRKQKVLLNKHRLNPNNWWVIKSPVGQLYIKHKKTGGIRIIKESLLIRQMR